jgi:hypothetical protein
MHSYSQPTEMPNSDWAANSKPFRASSQDRGSYLSMVRDFVIWKHCCGSVYSGAGEALEADRCHWHAGIECGKEKKQRETKDCQWIAELLQHGGLRASYIPSIVVRDLRDLTRARTSLS